MNTGKILTEALQERIDEKKREKMKEKICLTCKQKLLADLDRFGQANRAKDGLTKDCLKCRAVEPGPTTDPEQTTEKNNVTLDFSKHPEIFKKIKLLATENFRNHDQQILFCLKEYIPPADAAVLGALVKGVPAHKIINREE